MKIKTRLLMILVTLVLLSSLFTINEADGALCERIVDGICVNSNDNFTIPIIAGLENNTGIIALGNQTYYFETPNYAETAYVDPVQISFHDVVFTLFPSGFRGGLPTNDCGGRYLWTNVLFSDNIEELLRIFVDHEPCTPDSIPTMLSDHINPQSGLMFYDKKMKLLVSTDITNSTLQLEQDIEVNYVDFRDAEGEIIEVGCSLGLRASENSTFVDYFLDSLKCNSIVTLILVLALLGIMTGVIFIVWRKRK